jgi:hypothetical protein
VCLVQNRSTWKSSIFNRNSKQMCWRFFYYFFFYTSLSFTTSEKERKLTVHTCLSICCRLSSADNRNLSSDSVMIVYPYYSYKIPICVISDAKLGQFSPHLLSLFNLLQHVNVIHVRISLIQQTQLSIILNLTQTGE